MTVTNWARDVGRRIGLNGEVQFTMSQAGQTLHIPCTQCKETIDVLARPGLPPEGIAGKMLSLGWAFGRKLKCPYCSGKRKDKTRVESGKKTWAGKTPEERIAAMRAIHPHLKKKEETPVNSVTTIKAELLGGTAMQPKAAPSDAARMAHRLLMQALEDCYDDANKRYRPGNSDKKIADETGASEQHVRETREQYFGPLGEPSELTALREALSGAWNKIDDMKTNFERDLAKAINDIGTISERLNRLCIKNGWSV